jgi:ribonuclease HII
MGLLQTHTGKDLECGVDEVGRGCLAGPVVAAAVVLPRGFFLAGLRDSKKLTATQRQSAAKFIRGSGALVSIGEVPPARIDETNILNATYEAMHKAIAGLAQRPEYIICDGDRFRPYEDIPYETFVKGDDRYLSIAAASVVAKVYRDELMERLAIDFPGYGWEKNKGYGTAAHVEGLRQLGPCEHHRRTFIGRQMSAE